MSYVTMPVEFHAAALYALEDGPQIFEQGTFWGMTWKGVDLKVCPLLGLSHDEVIAEFWILYRDRLKTGVAP